MSNIKKISTKRGECIEFYSLLKELAKVNNCVIITATQKVKSNKK